MKIRAKIPTSQIVCILIFNALLTCGLVALAQNKFSVSVSAADNFSYSANINYNNAATPVAITFSEFKNGTSRYEITKYYEQVKDSIGIEGSVRGDKRSDNYCAVDRPDIYMVLDTNGDVYNAAENDDPAAKTAMLYNTYIFQYLVNCLSDYGSRAAKITLPSGTFYFLNGHNYLSTDPIVIDHKPNQGIEQHIIKPRNNVYIKGYSNNENGVNTTLKPYTDSNYAVKYDAAAPDMFFFNDYSASFFWPATQENKDQVIDDYYLKNNRYEYFIIDSEKASGKKYSSAGKGFMYNLFKNTDWHYVTVKNTDGTGFGVDGPINSKIDNCVAIGCGKGLAYPNASSGASGFGIGTGIKNGESLSITNSKAIGNRLFGIFFEHQNRFQDPTDKTRIKAYTATSGNYTVSNTISSSNWYNYGGYRAYDVAYGENNISTVDCTTINRSLRDITISTNLYNGAKNYNKQCTKASVYIDDNSRNTKITGIQTKIGNDKTVYFSDVKAGSYYESAIDWAVNNDIAHGWSSGDSEKTTGDTSVTMKIGVGEKLPRKDAVIYLWRYNNRAGKTVAVGNNNLNLSDAKKQYETTCFTDVDPSGYYAPAVKWALTKSVTNGVSGNCNSANLNGSGIFNPNEGITRAEFITMLWRMKGRPAPSATGDKRDFTDVSKIVNGESSWYYDAVKWARSIDLTNGTGNNEFKPNDSCTREQALSILCRLDGYCKIKDAKAIIKSSM